MGMFDYVNYEAPCPTCGQIIVNWQSKDGPCRLKRIKLRKVRSMIGSCACGVLVEAAVETVSTVTVMNIIRPVAQTERAVGS